MGKVSSKSYFSTLVQRPCLTNMGFQGSVTSSLWGTSYVMASGVIAALRLVPKTKFDSVFWPGGRKLQFHADKHTPGCLDQSSPLHIVRMLMCMTPATKRKNQGSGRQRLAMKVMTQTHTATTHWKGGATTGSGQFTDLLLSAQKNWTTQLFIISFYFPLVVSTFSMQVKEKRSSDN